MADLSLDNWRRTTDSYKRWVEARARTIFEAGPLTRNEIEGWKAEHATNGNTDMFDVCERVLALMDSNAQDAVDRLISGSEGDR